MQTRRCASTPSHTHCALRVTLPHTRRRRRPLQRIAHYRICAALPDFDLETVGRTVVVGAGGASFEVEVIDNTADYVRLLGTIFDWAALRALIARPDFSFVYDAMHGGARAPPPPPPPRALLMRRAV